MKFLLIFTLIAVLAIAAVSAVPARYPADDAELIKIPNRAGSPGRADSATDDDNDGDAAVDPFFKNFDGVIDTGAGYPFLQPNPNTFSFNLGFFDSFEDILRRLRSRWWGAELPGLDGRFGGSSDGDNDDDSVSIADPSGILPTLDDKKANRTHTVKVVNGHKVEVNDTVYGDNGNLFRVRVVNIRPVESGEDVQEVDVHKTAVAGNDGNNGNAGADGSNGNAGADGKPGANDPVTSAPTTYQAPRFDSDAKRNEIEDSDERREPLEPYHNKNNDNAASEIEVKQ